MLESTVVCADGRVSAACVGKECTLTEQYRNHVVAGVFECPQAHCANYNPRSARFCARCGGRLGESRASERGDSSYTNQRLIWIAPCGVVVGLLIVAGFAILGPGALLLIPAAIVGMWAFGVRFRDVQHPTGDSASYGNAGNCGNMGGQA